MNRLLLLLSFCTLLTSLSAQSPFNISVSSAEADAVLRGGYDPSLYQASVVIDNVDEIICALEEDVRTDSLFNLVQRMQDFETRNTYSDTVSLTRGIGATRRWVYRYFQNLSAEREGRLIPAYLDFEMPSSAFCGAGSFRNIFAVLPGRDATDPSVLFVEGHIDSRCEVLCDTNCYAPGAEDNGSGTALVMELARVMSQYTFDHTIVFLITVGEEQGLFGAEAFADYCANEGLVVKAVQNNDVTGGVICGPSSSPPSCPGQDEIDSTSVRLFSFGGLINSVHKDYARFMKTIYQEKVTGVTSVPMDIRIMSGEDRTGRGGDHIPFRQNGFRAIRVCASHEHGDANTSSAAYEGRQHTTRDVIGEDLDGDGVLDTLYIDFNYLKRNTVMNGASLAAAALGPDLPDFTLVDDGTQVIVSIDDPAGLNHYRVGVRENSHDFSFLYEVRDTTQFAIPSLNPSQFYRVTVAAVDEDGVTSLFAPEENFFPISVTAPASVDTVAYGALDCSVTGIESPGPANLWAGLSLHSIPNPMHQQAEFIVRSERPESISDATLRLHDDLGRLVWSKPVRIAQGQVRTSYDGPALYSGGYTLSLYIHGEQVRATRIAGMSSRR